MHKSTIKLLRCSNQKMQVFNCPQRLGSIVDMATTILRSCSPGNWSCWPANVDANVDVINALIAMQKGCVRIDIYHPF